MTRRDFLVGAAAILGAATLNWVHRLMGTPPAHAQSPTSTPAIQYLPIVGRNAFAGPRSSVVHIHAAGATHWDYASGWYGNYLDQAVVDTMVDRGLRELTGRASVAEAWAVLLPTYQPGQKIAVKVNFNNASCGDADNAIDALVEPVNALIRSLVTAGIQEQDVWVYDALRPIPPRFYSRRQYLQARYFDSAGCADERATFNRIDPGLRVSFSHPSMQTERWLTDLLFRATFLINMPILKRHGWHPVTLGFKNHFGSLGNLGGSGDDNPHTYINPSDSRYSSGYSPLVDINANANIANKTVLTIGDGLFGASSVGASPIRWGTFGNNAPNSLFFSRDRVAIDCVMCDFLRAEWGLAESAYDYLRLAQSRGLGSFERGAPSGSGYNQIIYQRIDL